MSRIDQLREQWNDPYYELQKEWETFEKFEQAEWDLNSSYWISECRGRF